MGRPSRCVFLSKVRRHPDGLAAGRTAGTTDRRAADFFRRRDVAVEQRRREIADSHIVEAVAGFVSGQKRADIDAQRQEVANSVLVFGSGQSPDRRGPARIRVRRGGAVECRFEIADRRVVGRFVRPLLSAYGWHLAGPELPDDLLPLVLMLGHVRPRSGRARGRLSSLPGHGTSRSTLQRARGAERPGTALKDQAGPPMRLAPGGLRATTRRPWPRAGSRQRPRSMPCWASTHASASHHTRRARGSRGLPRRSCEAEAGPAAP